MINAIMNTVRSFDVWTNFGDIINLLLLCHCRCHICHNHMLIVVSFSFWNHQKLLVLHKSIHKLLPIPTIILFDILFALRIIIVIIILDSFDVLFSKTSVLYPHDSDLIVFSKCSLVLNIIEYNFPLLINI